MTPMRARLPVVPLFAISVLLAACAPQPSSTQTRVELPQQLRLGQNALATTLERRSGRIAVIDAGGNVLVMDQTNGVQVQTTWEWNATQERWLMAGWE